MSTGNKEGSKNISWSFLINKNQPNKKNTHTPALVGMVLWLEYWPVHRKILDLIRAQGQMPGSQAWSPPSGHLWEATNPCIFHINISLLFFSAPPCSLPLFLREKQNNNKKTMLQKLSEPIITTTQLTNALDSLHKQWLIPIVFWISADDKFLFYRIIAANIDLMLTMCLLF